MNTHVLKSKTSHFQHLIDGNFFHAELRNNSDRNFQLSDHIHFIEVDSRKQITGNIVKAQIHKIKFNEFDKCHAESGNLEKFTDDYVNGKEEIFPAGFVLIEFFVFEVIQKPE
jgi:uncharacterized protein YqfB (UPF0267 family)